MFQYIATGKIILDILLLIITILYIASFIIGGYHYIQNIPKDVGFYTKKGFWAIAIGIVYSVHSIITSIILNKIFIDCPSYKENPDHTWFKLEPRFQILDILLSIGLICFAAHWVRNGFMKVLNKINSCKQNCILNMAKYLALFRNKREYDFSKVPEKNGNITVAFITFLFQRKLKNKFIYLINKYSL